jgi:hypothetical protein
MADDGNRGGTAGTTKRPRRKGGGGQGGRRGAAASSSPSTAAATAAAAAGAASGSSASPHLKKTAPSARGGSGSGTAPSSSSGYTRYVVVPPIRGRKERLLLYTSACRSYGNKLPLTCVCEFSYLTCCLLVAAVLPSRGLGWGLANSNRFCARGRTLAYMAGPADRQQRQRRRRRWRPPGAEGRRLPRSSCSTN